MALGGLWSILLLAIISGGSISAEWVPIGEEYQSPRLRTIYIDSTSVQRENNLVTMSVLIDWRSMQGGRSPTRFYSTKLSKQFDCQDKLVRTLAATDFYDHMGTAEVIGGGSHTGEGHWIAVKPETLNQGLWDTACGVRK